MPKKRGRSVEGSRKTATVNSSGARRAARASSASGDRDGKRAPKTRPTDKGLTLDSSPDVELWTPPVRPPNVVKGTRFSARQYFTDRPDAPVDDLFIPPVRSVKYTARELGFDGKGRCLFGCDGMRSFKFPDIAAHHYQCKFWQTVESQDKTPF